MARPREFDEGSVLDSVMNIFWQKGYTNTSLDDVIQLTGLRKGSLYSCFGNKERLFRLALDRYAAKGPFHPYRELKSPLKRLSAFYSSLIEDALKPGSQHRGCFIFNSSLEFSGKKDSLSAHVSKVGNRNESFFYELMKEAKEKNEISHRFSVQTAADRAHATAFTMREMSKFKPERTFLTDVGNSFFESIGAKERIVPLL